MISITLILVIMTALISYQAFQDPAMKGGMLLLPTAIKSKGEYYRFLTSGFIHADWMHLFINMYVLYMFGEYVEAQFNAIFGVLFGRIVYVLFYLSAIIVSSIPSYFRHQDNYGYAALGASGATSAMVFCYIFFNPWAGLTFLFFPFFSIPAIVLGVLYLLYSSYMDKRGTDNIGHNAHLWGAIYGLFFTFVSILLVRPELLDLILLRLLEVPGFSGS